MGSRLIGALLVGAAVLVTAIPAFALGHFLKGTVYLDNGEVIQTDTSGSSFHFRDKDWVWVPHDPQNPYATGNYINHGPPQSTFNFDPGGTTGGGDFQGSGACGNPSYGKYSRTPPGGN